MERISALASPLEFACSAGFIFFTIHRAMCLSCHKLDYHWDMAFLCRDKEYAKESPLRIRCKPLPSACQIHCNLPINPTPRRRPHPEFRTPLLLTKSPRPLAQNTSILPDHTFPTPSTSTYPYPRSPFLHPFFIFISFHPSKKVQNAIGASSLPNNGWRYPRPRTKNLVRVPRGGVKQQGADSMGVKRGN